NNAPVSTGIEVNRPNSSPLRPSSFLIGIPITPNITHTAKQTTNAQVVTPSTTMLLRFDMLPRWRADRPWIECDIRCGQVARDVTQECPLWVKSGHRVRRRLGLGG